MGYTAVLFVAIAGRRSGRTLLSGALSRGAAFHVVRRGVDASAITFARVAAVLGIIILCPGFEIVLLPAALLAAIAHGAERAACDFKKAHRKMWRVGSVWNFG